MPSSVSANAINCVKGEIHNVLTVLRMNARWASKERFKREIPTQSESPLIRALKNLHGYLDAISDLRDVDAVRYLEPFLAIVESPHTTGPMTGAALSSLHKFLLYGFMTKQSPRASEGIDRVAQCINCCHFEASDSAMDEVVLIKLLELSALCLRCQVGSLLSEDRCWEIFGACYEISIQESASSLLENTAVNTLANIVLMLFSQQRFISYGTGIHSHSHSHSSSNKAGHQERPLSPLQGDEDAWDDEEGSVGSEGDGERVKGEKPGCEENLQRSSHHKKKASNVSVLVEVMRFLSGLSNPRENTESQCVLGLSLINIALEAGGTGLGHHPGLLPVMQGDLCKHLLHNSQTSDLTILSLTLRVVFNLFNSIKDHLKVQLEVFLTSVHLRILDGKSHTPEQQELALESLLEFCREPALMLDLYINYDCDVQCTNLFETVCHALASAALPERSQVELNTLNRLALEGSLGVVLGMARGCFNRGLGPAGAGVTRAADLAYVQEASGDDQLGDGSSSETDSIASASMVEMGTPEGWLLDARTRTAEVLQQRKRMKRRLSLAVESFNKSDKGWLDYSLELGVVASKDAASIAKFLMTTFGLNKTLMGEYLSKGPPEKYPFNAAVLEEYVKLYEFSGLSFDEALRVFLKEFRLPGEAQCIDRLMEAFARELMAQCGDALPFEDSDAAFILAFSVIMLNTDLHSPQLREDRRMSCEGFIRNNRNINKGENLPEDFLRSIYDSIKQNEILVHRDHTSAQDDGLGIDYNVHWDGILTRSQHVTSASFTPAMVSSRKVTSSAGVHERDMFSSIAEPVLRATCAVFERTQDDLLVLRTLQGFRSYAQICVYYDLGASLDNLTILMLGYGSIYLQEALKGGIKGPMPECLYHPGLPDISDIDACAAVVEHGRNHREALALKLGLELLQSHGQKISSGGWQAAVGVLMHLLDLEALPPRLTELDDFSDVNGMPLPPSAHAKSCGQRAASAAARASPKPSSGLLGSLSSFFMSTAAPLPPQTAGVSDQNQAAVKESLTRLSNCCHVTQMFTNSKDLPDESVVVVMQALLAYCSPYGATEEVYLQHDRQRLHLFRAQNPCTHSLQLPQQASQSTPGSRPRPPELQPQLQPQGQGQGQARPDLSLSEMHAVLALELSASVTTANRHRLGLLYPLMHDALKGILSNSRGVRLMPFLAERALVTVLRTCIHMLDREDMREALMGSLDLLRKLPLEVIQPLSSRLALGLLSLVKANAVYLTKTQDWDIISSLLESAMTTPQGYTFTWETASYLATCGAIGSHNLQYIYRLLVRFIRGERWPPKASGADHTWTAPALKALEQLVVHTVPGLELPEYEALWESSLWTTRDFIAHPNQAVSKTAGQCMKRLLLECAEQSIKGWESVMHNVMLKLPFDSSVNKEVALSCCSLMSLTMLHQLSLLAEMQSFADIWLEALRCIGVNMTAGHSSLAVDTCKQIITNLVMVVTHAGGKNRDLLEDTFGVLDPVFPSLKKLITQTSGEPTSETGTSRTSSTSRQDQGQSVVQTQGKGGEGQVSLHPPPVPSATLGPDQTS